MDKAPLDLQLLVSGVYRGGIVTKAELEKLLETQAQMYDATLDMIESIDYLFGLEKQDQRAEKMGRRYLVDRQANLLSIGGFEAHYGRRLGMAVVSHAHPEVEDLQVEQADLLSQDMNDRTKAQKLGKADAAQGGLGAFMHNAVQALGETLAKRKADMAKTLNKKGWASGLTRFENIVKDSAELGINDKVEYATDAGAGLWLYGVRANQWRFDPDAMPGVGLANAIMATGGEIGVSIFEVPPLLTSGITVQDLKCFLETPSGQRYAKESSMVVIVPDGHVLFVAAGLIPMISYVATKEEVAKQQFGFALYLTVFGVSLATPLENATLAAIEKYNMSYLETVANDKRFGPRADLFTRYFSAVRDGNTS